MEDPQHHRIVIDVWAEPGYMAEPTYAGRTYDVGESDAPRCRWDDLLNDLLYTVEYWSVQNGSAVTVFDTAVVNVERKAATDKIVGNLQTAADAILGDVLR